MTSIFVVTGIDDGDLLEYEESSLEKAQEIIDILRQQGVKDIRILRYDTVDKLYHYV